ncbi:MAG: phosphodiester glycosidase family protein [Verrucomicrobiales bacterium]|nr:phosphodiester glycosidase family protein [Verrucomicrobiales bacterium]
MMSKQQLYSLCLVLISTLFCLPLQAQKPILLDGDTAPQWLPIFKGIEIARGMLTNDRDLQKCVAVRIDLREPGIRFFATPGNGAAAKETDSATAGGFLKKHQLQVVVNTSFFDPCCFGPAGEAKDLSGLAVAQGELVSPWSDTRPVGIAVSKNNRPFFVNRPPPKVGSLQFAVTGNTLLNEGKPTRKPNQKKEPRTAAGFSKDGRYLIFVVIDGRSLFRSKGANLYHTALWLIRFGAWQGCNLDGGGSSTLVMDNGKGGYRLLNYPSGGRERFVGNLLGVYATPLGAIKAKPIKSKKKK